MRRGVHLERSGMHEDSIDKVVERMLGGHEQSRRQFLARLGAMGVATSGAGVLVAGCGGGKGTTGQAEKQSGKAKTVNHPKVAIGNWTWSNWPLYMDKKLLKQVDKKYGGHGQDNEDNNDHAGVTTKGPAQPQAGDATLKQKLEAIAEVGKIAKKGQFRRFTGNDYSTDLAKGNAWISMAYSGDVVQLQSDNPELEFVYPKEGALLWTDQLMLPAKS